jgi:hypothetical protein
MNFKQKIIILISTLKTPLFIYGGHPHLHITFIYFSFRPEFLLQVKILLFLVLW